MAEQRAVGLGLALARTAQHREQLSQRLARQDGTQEHHGVVHGLEVGVKITACEAEQDAGVAHRSEQRIHGNAFGRVLQGDDQRLRLRRAKCTADDVGARVLVEDRAHELDAFEPFEAPQRLPGPRQLGRDKVHAALEVEPRGLEGVVLEDFLDHDLGPAVELVNVELLRRTDL